MRFDNFVSRKVYVSSIILLIISVIVGVYAASKEEYMIAVAMIFVLILQIGNLINYRQQNRNGGNSRNGGASRNGGIIGNKGCRNGRGRF